MTDVLFDPTPYGEGRPARRPATPVPTENDGDWWLLPQVGGPVHHEAHRKWTAPRNPFGADETVCGRFGQLLSIEPSATILSVCKRCASGKRPRI
jgi:hypothetical protein